MKKIVSFILLVAFLDIQSQVLITKFPLATGESNTPHESAMLEVRSPDKGILVPLVALTSTTDQVTVPGPIPEGTVVLNTSTNATDPDIPTNRPTIAVWDGVKWLFTYTKENVILDLDKVRNFTSENTTSVNFNSFPGSNPTFAAGQNTSGWTRLIDPATSQQPVFEFDYDKAEQRLVIDVEGIASVNGGNFSYAVGIFVDGSLVSAKKFYQSAPAESSTCYFHKFNLRAILEENTPNVPTQVLNHAANVPYDVEVWVRPLQRESGVDDSSNTNLIFGNAATGCSNLNAATAKSYMNILTIERKDN